MRFFILASLFMFLISCSSSVTDPKNDQSLDGTGLSYRPEITMYNFLGGDAYRADGSYKILFKVKDEVMGVNESVIEYKKNSDASWTLIQDKVLSSSDKLTEVVWNIPAQLSGNDFKLRITAYGKTPASKQLESLTTFTIDGLNPSLAASGFTLASLPASPFSFFKPLSIMGDADDLSGVGGYCLSSSSVSVYVDDTCWRQKSLVDKQKVPFYAGMLTQTQDVFLNVKDLAGNIYLSTSTTGTDVLSVTQSNVTIPATSNSFYLASSSGDSSKHLGLTLQNTSTSYAYSNFTNNSTQSIDPGAIAYLPSGAILVRDRVKGIRKIDLINMCSSEPCNSILIGTASSAVDGAVNGTAKLVEPLRMFLSSDGHLWILDRKAPASSELVIRKVDFNSAQPQLVTLIGGGSKEDDSVTSATDLKITYSEGLVFYGAFQALPNGWLVFHSTNPEAALNSGNSNRYKLRIFKPNESSKIQTLYLSSEKVYNIASHTGKDIVPTSAPAILYDERFKDISSIYLRVCELTLPVSTGQACSDLSIYGFDKTGQAQSNLQIASFVPDGNLILESTNGYDLMAKSGISSELRRYNFISSSWETLAGNGSRGSAYCANGAANSSCSLRLKDAVYEPAQGLTFILDHSKVRMVVPDLNKVYSLVE